MDATLIAMCSAMMNTTATGAPVVLPVIPSADSNQNPPTSSSAATSTSHKAEKESERRDKTNQLFAELQKLVSKDYNGKMR